MIEVRDLYKSFNNLEVIKGVTLKVERGEVVSIIGSSGSGKSTLLRCINFLEKKDRGEIVFDGKVIGKAPHEINQLRKRVGMVFQNFNLFPNMTVLENVMSGPKIIKKMKIEKAEEIAREFLNKVGLEDKADTYPSKLSGGQKQRVAIARALITDPKIILADEPTGALDSKTTYDIMKLLQEINRSGKTIIVVTHEPDVAAETKRNVILKDGIIESDEFITQRVLA